MGGADLARDAIPLGLGGVRALRGPDQGLIDHLLACPYPFEIPPRAKDAIRPISL